jgi:MFS family permease
MRKIVFAAFLGTALEWYDFFLYGTAASIVFAKLFFAETSGPAAAMLAFLTFAAGFLARPVGAVIFGHFGDRLGRRRTLIITVSVMGVATGLIGVLPTYAALGIAAPILLTCLRVLQGLSAGGEWGGATLLALEHAPADKRGRYASMIQLGSPAGTLLSSAAFSAVALLPNDALLSWGWRLPFLASFLLVVLALWMRWRVEETPVFRALVVQDRVEKLPVVELLREAPGRLAIGAATYLFGVAGFFLLTTFMIGFATETRGISKSVILNALLVGAVAEAIALVIAGKVADRIGAAKTVAYGYVLAVVTAFPIFWLVDTANTALVVLALILGLGLASVPYAPVGAVLTKLFPERLHYSGVALSANLAGVVAGFMPAAALFLQNHTGGGSTGPATLLLIVALISLCGAYLAYRITEHPRRSARTEPVTTG